MDVSPKSWVGSLPLIPFLVACDANRPHGSNSNAMVCVICSEGARRRHGLEAIRRGFTGMARSDTARSVGHSDRLRHQRVHVPNAAKSRLTRTSVYVYEMRIHALECRHLRESEADCAKGRTKKGQVLPMVPYGTRRSAPDATCWVIQCLGMATTRRRIMIAERS